MHIVLLGDSIFDNKVYVGTEPDVVNRLRARLPSGGRATLRAVDGHTSREVRGQLSNLPSDATHLVVSAGGNDALGNISLLAARTSTVGAALVTLAAAVEEFAPRYRAMRDAVRGRCERVVLCTVYDPNFDDAATQQAAVTALAAFNGVILRAAFEAGLPVVDLRLVLTEPGDYANEIEPSSRGGDKIAAAVLNAVREHDWARGRSSVYTR